MIINKDPEFVIYAGPMFGAKSSKLISALIRCKYQNVSTVAFKPEIDGRYSQDNIVTHGGISWPATKVSSGQDILCLSGQSRVIGVDEAFMIPGCAQALIKLFKQGRSIYVSSIQLSATGKPFDEIKEMMPFATKIEVCPAVCPHTQKDAYYTASKVKQDNEISVGGAEAYEPVCWEYADFMKEDLKDE